MIARRIFFIFIFSVLNCIAYADTTFVSFGASWKYFDSGFLPSVQWTDTTFNDSSWANGNAEFGYGDGDETTLINYGSNANEKYITTYFRKFVSITDSSLYSSFQMNIKRDDGIVVYINGSEVFRSNMPAGIVTDSTLASAFASDDGNTPQTVLLPASAFPMGLNVIAVEVHQSDLTSTDLSFDMELNAFEVYVPQIIRQPYLQMLSADGITVKWRTDIATFSMVCFGIHEDSLANCVMDTVARTDHEVRLIGLDPSTKYFYSIGDGVNVLQGDSANYFITSPTIGTPKHTRVWVLSDAGVNALQQNNVRDAFLTYSNSFPPDFLLMLGDNAYNLGTDQEYQEALFENHYENIIKNLPVYSTAGNHENYSSDALTQTGPYYDIFSLPANGEAGGLPSGSEAYYSFDYGNIHFVCLESNTPVLRLPGSDMLTWLANDLASTHQKWKVVYFHNPPYTKGGHNSDSEGDLIEIRQNIVPLLEQYKTDLVLNGHSHVYERSFLMHGHYGLSNTLDNTMIIDTSIGTLPAPLYKRSADNYTGTVYVQAGVSGVVESIQPDWPHPVMRFVDNVNLGSLLLEVDTDTLTLKFIDSDIFNPHVIDNFSIVKRCDVVPALSPVTRMCYTDNAVVLSASPPGGIFSGDGITDSLFNPYLAGGGVHSVTYTFADDYACNVFATTQIEVVGSVPDQPAMISGPSLICPPVNNLELSILSQPDADTYQWSLASGTSGINLLYPKTDTIILLNATTLYPSYTINVVAENICGYSAPSSITMASVKNFPVWPYGSNAACPLDTIVFSTLGLNALATYTWSAPAGGLINGQQSPLTTNALTEVSVIFPAGFITGNVCVANHAACLMNSNIKCILVSSVPKQPGSIQGVNGITPGTSGIIFSVDSVPGATGYTWTMPPNAILVSGQNSNSVVVDFNPSYTTDIISVKASGECGESTPSTKLIRVITMFGSPVNIHLSKTEDIMQDSAAYSGLEISVFPNPAENELGIHLTGQSELTPYEILLTDISGKLMKHSTGNANPGNFSERISIQSFAGGVYLLAVITPSHQFYQRIVKR